MNTNKFDSNHLKNKNMEIWSNLNIKVVHVEKFKIKYLVKLHLEIIISYFFICHKISFFKTYFLLSIYYLFMQSRKYKMGRIGNSKNLMNINFLFKVDISNGMWYTWWFDAKFYD